MTRHFTLLTALALTLSTLRATTPAVGQKVADVSLVSTTGNTVRLSDLYAKSRVALVVLRGYPGYQCPFCQRQVQDYVKNASAFAGAGVRVVFVYPGPADRARQFLEGKNFPSTFEMLLDPDYAFTNLYGLRWEAPAETAYPSTFLIDRQGVVFFVQSAKLHAGRTTAADVLSYLK